MELVLDAGGEDLQREDAQYVITTAPADFHAVRSTLQSKGLPIVEAELAMVPKTTVKVEGRDAETLLKLIDGTYELFRHFFAVPSVKDAMGRELSRSRPGENRIGNSFLATVVDIAQFRDRAAFDQDVDQLSDYVKSSKLADGSTEILVPGEPEKKERERREKNGVPVDEETWRQIRETAARYRADTDLG